MVDVDCALGETPCLTAGEDSGYEIDEAEVICWADVPTASRRLLSRRRRSGRVLRNKQSDTVLDPRATSVSKSNNRQNETVSE